jgi:hypothetical protein
VGGEEVLHPHHVVGEVVLHPHQVVDMAVLHWLVGIGDGVDGVVETAVLHRGSCSVGRVAHYLHLSPGGSHVDEEVHFESGSGWCHGVDGHLDHAEHVDDHHGHEEDGDAHLRVEAG